MFQKKETPKKLFIFEKIELSELKKSLLKCVLYFRKLNISTPTLKNYFLGESLRVFHHCFFRCFISTLIFTIVFGCFHCWLYLFTSWLFIQLFRCFHFTTDFITIFWVFSFHQLSLQRLLFDRYFVFVLLHRECYGFEMLFFLISGAFCLTLFPNI